MDKLPNKNSLKQNFSGILCWISFRDHWTTIVFWCFVWQFGTLEVDVMGLQCFSPNMSCNLNEVQVINGCLGRSPNWNTLYYRESHHIHTWNPNDPSFDWKKPCFGGVKAKNRGQTGSRYILHTLRINAIILLWGWNWDHQTYSREGVWILRDIFFFHINLFRKEDGFIFQHSIYEGPPGHQSR